MPVTHINSLLAIPWGPFSRSLDETLQSAVGPDWSVEPNLAAPPGYETLSLNGAVLHLPLEAGGWSLLLHGPLNTVIHVDQFRLSIHVPLDPSDPLAPRVDLKGVRVIPEIVIHSNGALGSVRVVIDGLKREDADGQTRYTVDLKSEPDADVTLTGTLTLDVLASPRIRFAGRIVGLWGSRDLHYDWTVPLSDPMRNIMLILADDGIPRQWGHDAPPALSPPLDTSGFHRAAMELEDCVYRNQATWRAADGKVQLVGITLQFAYEMPNETGPLGSFDHYAGEKDSAIWTGHYLAAEAFRYASAITPGDHRDAVARLNMTLDGIERLFAFTYLFTGKRVRGLLTRAVMPRTNESHIPTVPPMDDAGDAAGDYYPAVSMDGLDWYAMGRGEVPPTRDQYIGVAFGLSCLWRYVDDPAIRERAEAIVTDMVRLLLGSNWCLQVPEGPADAIQWRARTTWAHEFHHQLAYLRLGATVRPAEFEASYQNVREAADLAWVSVWGNTLDPVEHYFKFNLDHAALAILLTWETDPSTLAHYRTMLAMLRRSIGHHRNPYFNLHWILSDSSYASEPSVGAPGLTVAQETQALLQEWLVRRSLIPGPHGSMRNMPRDRAALARLYPGQVSEYAANHWITNYPLSVINRTGRDMDFMWQHDPFSTGLGYNWKKPPGAATVSDVAKGMPDTESPGVDYLLAYWMALMLGVIAASE